MLVDTFVNFGVHGVRASHEFGAGNSFPQGNKRLPGITDLQS